MKKVLILVEGHSEERFVKDVLRDHLFINQVNIIPKLITTKVVRAGPNHKGGHNSFTQFKRDLHLLLSDSSAAVVTMLVDLYRLPEDFPQYELSLSATTLDNRINILSEALTDHFPDRRFLPYFSVHEYEALTLVDVAPFVDNISPPVNARGLSALCSVTDPETINCKNPPAARIKSFAPNYNKHLHGAIIIQEHGLANVRKKCKRFDRWLTTLEGL